MPVKTMSALDGTYDVIVLGSGLKEQLIGSLLSMTGKKVLIVICKEGYDSNNLINPETEGKILDVYKYSSGQETIETDKGQNVFPEFMKETNSLYSDFKDMRIWLEKTNMLQFLEVKHQSVAGDVFRAQIKHIIPTDADELLASGLMGILEKRRYLAFRDYCIDYRQDRQTTHKSFNAQLEMNKSAKLYADFGFDPYGQEFNGQAVARFSDEKYLEQPAYDLIRRIQLCHNNLAGNVISAYFLPLYRTTEHTSVQEIKRYAESTENGKVAAVYHICEDCDSVDTVEVIPAGDGKDPQVRIGKKYLTCKLVICHPVFATDKCDNVGEVARQVFLCHTFDKISTYCAAHWRIPYKQMKAFTDKESDICFTFLSPHLLLSKTNNNEKPLYIGMVETMVDSTQSVEEKLKDGINFVEIRDHIKQRYDVVRTTLWKPRRCQNNDDKSKVIITDYSEMSIPFEVICGEASDVIKRAMKLLNEACGTMSTRN